MNSRISDLQARVRVGALIRGLADAEGNRDGITKNETQPAGQTASVAPWLGQELLNRYVTAFEPGLSTADERHRLAGFVAAQERRWGQRVHQLEHPLLGDIDLFRAEKAIALVRFGRAPGDVTEGHVRAAGSVAGQRISPREVFWQRWAPHPSVARSDRVIIVSPGFQETGRNFYEQIDLLNREGHEVVVMDHQWAGYTGGQKGGVDRGFGIARDVAAVVAMVSARLRAEGDERLPMLLGNSMGAGPGVLGAITMNDAGAIELEGPPMPRGVDAILQAPYLRMTPRAVNTLAQVLAKVPGLRSLALPSLGLPIQTHDPAGRVKLAQHIAEEGTVVRPQAVAAPLEDIEAVLALIAKGRGPQGGVYIIHGDRDPLADPRASRALVEQLGPRATLALIESPNHILEEAPDTQRHVLEGVRWLQARASARPSTQ